ncbi:MAG: hypothetical protein ACHQF3_16615 [Alphaproteobacteria bacterium]
MVGLSARRSLWRMALALIVATLPIAVSAQAADVPAGRYECWYFTRAQPGLNFTIVGGGKYTDVQGTPGSYAFSSDAARLTFKAGALDGQRATYRPGNPPSIAFLSERNTEAAVCQLRS